MEFEQLLKIHKSYITSNMNKLIIELENRRDTHDNDKLFNEIVFDIYNKHFKHLKAIEFGTKEYYQYEQDHFDIAHQIHAQNRHHFYSHRNKTVSPNLVDLLEAVVDIYASNLQYSDNVSIDEVLDVIKGKGICDIDLDTYILNTLKLLEEN